jgi:hypothetical protein
MKSVFSRQCEQKRAVHSLKIIPGYVHFHARVYHPISPRPIVERFALARKDAVLRVCVYGNCDRPESLRPSERRLALNA